MNPRTRQQGRKMVKELEGENSQSETEIAELEDRIRWNRGEIKRIKSVILGLPEEDRSQLGRLWDLVQKIGTGHEVGAVERALLGEDLDESDLSRIRTLGIAHLHEVVEGI